MPLAEVVTDFLRSDESRNQGHALDGNTSLIGYRKNELVRLECAINLPRRP